MLPQVQKLLSEILVILESCCQLDNHEKFGEDSGIVCSHQFESVSVALILQNHDASGSVKPYHAGKQFYQVFHSMYDEVLPWLQIKQWENMYQ